jgi:catechol 2,3-dioxygenase-like lactoylglutathione lyase family enzyme
MKQMIQGLHHVTVTVAGAQEDLDFYGGLLGLRLVKKTDNFDNSSVCQFYYGDERGAPGTLMTTFPYRTGMCRSGGRVRARSRPWRSPCPTVRSRRGVGAWTSTGCLSRCRRARG